MPTPIPKKKNKPKPSIHQQRMGKWAKVLLVVVIIAFTLIFYFLAIMSNKVGGGSH